MISCNGIYLRLQLFLSSCLPWMMFLSAGSLPNSQPGTSKYSYRVYKVPKSHSYFVSCPKADPAVMASYSTAAALATLNSLPTDKDGKAFDRFGKNVYASFTLALSAQLPCTYVKIFAG